MLVLAISTSSKICSVALLEDDKCIKELNIENQKTHSENLVPLIDEVLTLYGKTISDINLIVCDNGPGSFTAIRIRISTCKAIAEVNNIPIITCTSLESLSYNASGDFICSLIDARNNQVYYGAFDSNHNLINSYMADDINTIINSFPNGNITFIGDGAILHKEILNGTFINDNNIHAANVGICGYKKFIKNNLQNPDSANPMYLRKSRSREDEGFKMISISLMSLEDLNSISDILYEEFDDFWNYNILKKELENNNSKNIVAKEDNIVIGFAVILDTSDQLEITNIVVKKAYRNKGIGSLMLKYFIDFAKSNHRDKIFLEVNSKNIPAVSLYEKYGFKKCGLRPKYYNYTDDAILMTLNLK